MPCQNTCLIVLVVMCASFSSVYSLYCYECSSLLDDKCGITWGYNDEHGPIHHRQKCEGSACRKMVHRDILHNNVLVVRSCWNKTTDEKPKSDFFTCSEYMVDSEVCYCDDYICNGMQVLQPHFWMFVLGLFPFICKLLLR